MQTGRHFSHNRYYDRVFRKYAVRLLPGEYHATGEGTIITTVLGSCVSVCLYDALHGVGGMNHYLLPGEALPDGKANSGSARYGRAAMELLLQHLLALGAERSQLTAKIFGAGRVMDRLSDVGRQNADFAVRFLNEQKIRIAAVDVGDVWPRKICFSPATGQVFVKRIQTQALPAELAGGAARVE
jgi:chemotaxis protein CheD